MSGLERFLQHYGLRIRIIATIAALTVVLVFLIGVVVLKIAEHNFMRQKITMGNLALHGLQSALDTFWYDRSRLIVQPEDVDRLNRLVTTTGRNLGLIDLWLVDDQMRVIAARDQQRLGSVVDEEAVIKAFQTGKIERSYVGEQGAFGFGLYEEMTFAGPLFLENEIVGVARFALPLEDVSSSLAGTLNMLYLYTFFDVMMVLIIGGFLMMYFVVRPLNELQRATERIIQGELDHPIPVRTNDEIGLLAQSLEELRNTLAEKEQTVRQQMQSLEALNRRLTDIRDQLIHTDRLAYLGRVAAGVAHEIGNPLGSIYGYIDILKSCSDDPAVCSDVLDRMSQEIGRIDAIMKELLTFSRRQKESRAPVNLTTIARECIEILKTQRMLDQVTVSISADPKTPNIVAEPGQLKQVFLNLIVNAVDAMDGEGKIDVLISHGTYDKMIALAPLLGSEPELETGETAYTDQEKRGIVFSSRIPYTEGEQIVMVSVRDTGPGIESKNLSSIFEPFFTTKEKSKGTGLGLSICQRIVEGIGGLLRVQGRPGKGTVVTCFFLTEREDASIDGDVG